MLQYLPNKKTLLSLLFSLFLINANAQTTLALGDIAFTGYNCTPSANSDEFSFVILKSGGITSGTTIYFTDRGWKSNACGTNNFCTTSDNASFPESGSEFTWTAGSALAYGAQVKITGAGTSTTFTCSNGSASGTVLNLSNAGDQIFALQGGAGGTMLAAIHANKATAVGCSFSTGSWDDCTSNISVDVCQSSNNSNKPACLTVGTNCIVLLDGSSNEVDNGRLKTTVCLTGNQATDLAIVNNLANWDVQNSTAYTVGTAISICSNTTWNGSTWSNGTPNSTLDAIIASSTAPSSFTCKALTINSTFALTTTGITATVNGDIANNGNGIAGTGGLTIAANATISGNAISFNGVLTVNSGATLTTGGLLTLSSNATNTARVANSAGSISGNVTVERYIPAKRAWRLLTSPLRGSNTSVYSSWQNNGSVIANTGVEIFHPSGGTGIVTGGGNTLNGNLRTYNTTNNTWTPVTNTQTTNLFTSASSAANNAFLIFPTAPYGGGNIVNGATATTLLATGTLQTGTQTFAIPNAAFSNSEKLQLIGNPYASPVDFNLLTRTNVTKRFWVWDPQLSGLGAYVLLSDIDNDGNYSVIPSSTQTQHIQSGQAFFVEVNNTGASLVFNEDDKSTSNINTVFRTGTGTERLSIDMINPNDGLVIDGILPEYNNNFSNGIAAEDGQKFFRSGENFYLTRNTKPLMLEGRKLIDNNDTLFLTLSGMQQQAYRFAINGSNFANDANLSAYLKDKFLSTETAISLSGATEYNFTVTADVNSKAADRFMVVFRSTSSLPVALTNVKAFQQNSGIAVEWNTQSESGMQQYEVEKSANGTNFVKVNTTAAKPGTTNSYNFFDATPFSGANYYRIKAISINGDVKYSSMIVIRWNTKVRTINLYPNPLKGDHINLELNGLDKGNYTVTLYNQLGQIVLTRAIQHNETNAIQTINLGKIRTGVYQLCLSNQQVVITQKLIKE